MKFELGQKVKYKKVVRKTHIYLHCKVEDFYTGETKEVIERRSYELSGEKIGIVMGKRKLIFSSILGVKIGDFDQPYIEAIERPMKQVYLIAYDLGHTNYVLEEDLKEVK
jgi:hypothetical protein